MDNCYTLFFSLVQDSYMLSLQGKPIRLTLSGHLGAGLRILSKRTVSDITAKRKLELYPAAELTLFCPLSFLPFEQDSYMFSLRGKPIRLTLCGHFGAYLHIASKHTVADITQRRDSVSLSPAQSSWQWKS